MLNFFILIFCHLIFFLQTLTSYFFHSTQNYLNALQIQNTLIEIVEQKLLDFLYDSNFEKIRKT